MTKFAYKLLQKTCIKCGAIEWLNESQTLCDTCQPVKTIKSVQPKKESEVINIKKEKTFKYGGQNITVINSDHELVPTNANEVSISAQDKSALAVAINHNIPTLLVGETGTGKSSIVKYLAFKRKQPYMRVNMNGYTTPDELIGHVSVKDGATYFEDGVIVKAMREGAILVLDEVNGTTQDCLFVLHGLLDDDKRITLPDGSIVEPHEDFRVFATCNPDYEGTKTMNKAFVDRFGIILAINTLAPKLEVSLLVKRTGIDEKTATSLVTIATQARKAYTESKLSTFVSTRALIGVANLIKQGMTVESAFKVAIEQKTTNRDEQRILHDFYLSVLKISDSSNELDVPVITTQREIQDYVNSAENYKRLLTQAENEQKELSQKLELNEGLESDYKTLEIEVKEKSSKIVELEKQVESYKRLEEIIQKASTATNKL